MRTSAPASPAFQFSLKFLVLAALAIAYARLAQIVFHFGADPSIYIGTARSLASGDGFTFAGRAQTQYPPAWPLLLVPLSWLSRGDYTYYARFTAALFPFVCLASYALYRTRKERHARWLLVMLLGSTSVFNIATRDVRSEVLFTAATIGFLAWCLASDLPRSRVAVITDIAVGTILMVTAVAARTIGIALLAAVILLVAHLTARSRGIPWAFVRRIAAPFMGCVVYLAWWTRWTRAHHIELYSGEFMNSYGRQFWLRDPHFPDAGAATTLDVLHRIPGNITFQAAHNAELLTNIGWLSPEWTSPVLLVAALVVFAGLVDEFRRNVPILAYYAVAYVGILSVWPFEEDSRFLVPLFPIVLLFALQGWRILWRTAELHWKEAGLLIGVLSLVELSALAYKYEHSAAGLSRHDVAAVLVWLLFAVLAPLIAIGRARPQVPGLPRVIRIAYLAGYFVLGGLGIATSARSHVRKERGARAESLHALSLWIGENSPKSTVIMAQSYASLELTTSRRVVPFPITSNPIVLRNAVVQQRPGLLVVLDSESASYFTPSETARRAILDSVLGRPLELKLRVKGGAIYGLLSPAASSR